MPLIRYTPRFQYVCWYLPVVPVKTQQNRSQFWKINLGLTDKIKESIELKKINPVLIPLTHS